MLLESIIFWVFATFSVVGALGVVFHRSIVYAALFLIGVFLSIAGIFVLNNADFLAVAQTVVYGVGLTIVILFGIMFTGDRLFQDRAVTKRQLFAYLLVAGMTFAVLLPTALYAYNVLPTPPMLAGILQRDGSTPLLGLTLFNQYALPFELASVLLLGAMVGAILISKKSFDDVAPSVKYQLATGQLTDEAKEALVAHPTSLAVSPHAVLETNEDLAKVEADEQHLVEV